MICYSSCVALLDGILFVSLNNQTFTGLRATSLRFKMCEKYYTLSQGKDGDRMNAMLSGCGFNLRKLLRAFFLPFFQRLFWRYLGHWFGWIGLNIGQSVREMKSAYAF
jgi:hypothetical protein